MQDVTKDRNLFVGGSDVPIILGISPFKTRWELLQEKAGITQNDFEGNAYTEYGNLLEPMIRDYINSTGYNFVEDKRIDGRKRYHADGWDEKKKTVLEIKTTSQVHDSLDGYKKYLVQLQMGMEMFGVKRGILAIYKRPEDFSETFDESNLTIYEVKSDKALSEEINTAIERFLVDLDKLKENPFLTEEELQPFEIIALTDRIVELENSLSQMKFLEEESKRVKAELKEAMERNGIKKWTTNNGVKITLVSDGIDKMEEVFDSKSFLAENADLGAKYMIQKVKKGKAGYVKITLPK